jgi:hypothetical protein
VIEKPETPEDKIAPTLIYSGLRKAKFQVMKMVNQSSLLSEALKMILVEKHH